MSRLPAADCPKMGAVFGVFREVWCQKRFSQGRLSWWPRSAQASQRLSARELQILLWNGNPEDAAMADDWRQVA